MAHPQQLCYIGTLSKHLSDDYKGVKILEIGSYNVNGTIRDFFIGSDYIGTDLADGPGVDVVADGHLINHGDNTYDITVSCECFEHNPYWLETFLNMYRMTTAGGFVIFTCATRRRLEHGTRRTSPNISPGTNEVGWDYYLNLEAKDFAKRICLEELFDTHLFLTNKYSRDLYFVGRKVGGNSRFHFDKDRFVQEHERQQELTKRSVKTQRYWCAKNSRIPFWIYFPNRLAIYLPERHFQNFSVTYINFVEAFKAPLRSLFRSPSKSTPPQA